MRPCRGGGEKRLAETVELTKTWTTMAAKKGTPDTLPWIPPGKPKEETFNKFAHKKGSLASRAEEEAASKKGSVASRSDGKKHSRTSRFSTGSQADRQPSDDSGRESENSFVSSQHERDQLKVGIDKTLFF